MLSAVECLSITSGLHQCWPERFTGNDGVMLLLMLTKLIVLIDEEETILVGGPFITVLKFMKALKNLPNLWSSNFARTVGGTEIWSAVNAFPDHNEDGSLKPGTAIPDTPINCQYSNKSNPEASAENWKNSTSALYLTSPEFQRILCAVDLLLQTTKLLSMVRLCRNAKHSVPFLWLSYNCGGRER